MSAPVKSAKTRPDPVQLFVAPMIGLPAWGVKQGYGSFLTFEFGEPKLQVHEWRSKEQGPRRSAYVRGRWHLWIYCCRWRAGQHGEAIAQSDDADEKIACAAAALNGQKLLGVEADPARGRSRFAFDLGGWLETWPSGDDPGLVQWMILTEDETLAWRADGRYSRGPTSAPVDSGPWLEPG